MTHLLNKHSQYNQSPLEIATFDGYNSPYHPSVLYFEATWNGYSFWMANSPYPHKTTPYRDRFECPSVFVSNDGYHWDSVNGMSNPIDDLTAEEIKDYDYLSDPHLFVKDGALECWYRKTKRHGKHNYGTRHGTRQARRQTAPWMSFALPCGYGRSPLRGRAIPPTGVRVSPNEGVDIPQRGVPLPPTE